MMKENVLSFNDTDRDNAIFGQTAQAAKAVQSVSGLSMFAPKPIDYILVTNSSQLLVSNS